MPSVQVNTVIMSYSPLFRSVTRLIDNMDDVDDFCYYPNSSSLRVLKFLYVFASTIKACPKFMFIPNANMKMFSTCINFIWCQRFHFLGFIYDFKRNCNRKIFTSGNVIAILDNILSTHMCGIGEVAIVLKMGRWLWQSTHVCYIDDWRASHAGWPSRNKWKTEEVGRVCRWSETKIKISVSLKLSEAIRVNRSVGDFKLLYFQHFQN